MPPSTFTPALTSAAAPYGWLITAILLEVAGTACMVKTEQFSRLLPSVAMAAFYALPFYCLSQALKTIPVGIAYALWGGIGIALTTLAGVVAVPSGPDCRSHRRYRTDHRGRRGPECLLPLFPARITPHHEPCSHPEETTGTGPPHHP